MGDKRNLKYNIKMDFKIILFYSGIIYDNNETSAELLE
jgi:hypothetical protein